MDRPEQTFQRLKPACVSLSEAALALNGANGDIQIVADRLQQLQQILSPTLTTSPTLDPKLADYVFFPLSSVLKFSHKLSIRCLELALQCIEVLIKHGWRQAIQPPLAAQFVILFTLLAEKHPNGLAFSTSTDELTAAAFSCLYCIFSLLELSLGCRTLFADEANFPQLGQTISVILDGIQDGESSNVQIAATRTLEAFVNNIKNRELHAAFMPGIVSKLTKTLRPQTTQRRNPKVLIGCLSILQTLLSSTLGQSSTTSIMATSGSGKNVVDKDKDRTTIVDSKWLESAAEQLKPAFSNIFRLQDHSREDVQEALASLCVTLLQDCRATLSGSITMALQTLLILCAQRPTLPARRRLEALVREESSLPAMLQSTLYDWANSLITVMQSPDAQLQTKKLEQLGIAYEILARNNVETSVIDRLLAVVLNNSVATTTATDTNHPRVSPLSSAQLLDTSGFGSHQTITKFSPLSMSSRGQEKTIEALEGLIKAITHLSSTVFVRDIAKALQQSDGDSRIAGLWLLYTVVEEALSRNETVDDLLDLPNDTNGVYNLYLEDLYSLSLTILNTSSQDDTSPMLKSLAIRTLALRARTAGPDFRYELVDALYPVLHALATPDLNLQRDSVTALNIFASACNYASVKHLIVENADYLTNAVALKLNAFDISPQAPQVLLMMLKLAGPTLLPYLQDTVESIFAALEDYHGYPLLVELLFRVLGVMADEGAKAPLLMIKSDESAQTSAMLSEVWKPTSMSDLAASLRERLNDELNDASETVTKPEPHPEVPWKSHSGSNEGEKDEDADDTSVPENEETNDVELPPPAPKTYQLLLKITEMTQHFLPSASSSLRTSLLGLIKTTTPAIAKHENSFLPLVNSLWPEIVSRLDDEEPQIVATALETIGVLCQYARDFMRTRIAQLWPRLEEMHGSISTEILRPYTTRTRNPAIHEHDRRGPQSDKELHHAVQRMEFRPADYTDTVSRNLWAALTGVLAAIVENVPLSPEMFDEALKMLLPALGRDNVRSSLEAENADALWLAELKAGKVERPQRPELSYPHERSQFAMIPA